MDLGSVAALDLLGHSFHVVHQPLNLDAGFNLSADTPHAGEHSDLPMVWLGCVLVTHRFDQPSHRILYAGLLGVAGL